jgi:hypothetical protein
MASIATILARANALAVRDNNSMSSTTIDLLITLMALIFVSLLLIGALYTIRRVRRRGAIARQQLPLYNEKPTPNNSRLTITASRNSSIYVYDEKASMMNSPNDVPEIRITFPDEQDEAGRPKSGRVVVVRVGETGVGLEPLRDEEQLPAYQKEGGDRFHSIDMERIGGLKEKSQYS